MSGRMRGHTRGDAPGEHGIEVSAETVRRWLHEIGWGWKRAELVAKDDAPWRSKPRAPRECTHRMWADEAPKKQGVVCWYALQPEAWRSNNTLGGTMSNYLVFILGVIAAGVGGELFGRGSVGVAELGRIPPGIIGATIAAFARFPRISW